MKKKGGKSEKKYPSDSSNDTTSPETKHAAVVKTSPSKDVQPKICYDTLSSTPWLSNNTMQMRRKSVGLV